MFEKLMKNTHAASAMSIIMLSVALLIGGSLIPVGIVAISNQTAFAGAPSTVVALVPILGIIGIAAVILIIVRSVKR